MIDVDKIADFFAEEQVTVAKTQEAILTEQLAEMNPDYLFLQFTTSEGKDASNVFEELKQNPIVQQINAFKTDHVYVNVVDPMMEGGTGAAAVEGSFCPSS